MSDSVVNIILSIVQEIVDNPDAVEVNRIDSEKTTIIEILAPKEDVGKVIGKNGAMAKALRTICSSISGKHDHRYLVQIVE